MPNKLTTDGFIEKAIVVHGTKYDYSKVVYVRNSDKVIIICREHGEFSQLPKNHLKGCGCPYCSGNAPLNTESFIERAIEIHGEGIYDYSKVEYVRIMDKVIIICPVEGHGEFTQSPNDHLNNGSGCRKCSGRFPLTTETFTQKAIEVHGMIT